MSWTVEHDSLQILILFFKASFLWLVGLSACPFCCPFLQVQNLDQNLADAQVQQEAALKSLRHNWSLQRATDLLESLNELNEFNLA